MQTRYFGRGTRQFWCIKGTGALLISLSEEGKHYDGDAHIFFKKGDSSIPDYDDKSLHKISKKEFENARQIHIDRLNQF